MNWFHQRVCRSGRWRGRLERELLPWALQGVELGEDVLELGPGPGATTDLLRRRTQRLTALEVDATAATALQKRLNNFGVRVVHGDAAAMPFPDGSFSSVVSFTMLHHLATTALQDRILTEARRVLRPGAVFAGFDGVGSFLFRLVHLGDIYTPVNPNTFAGRLEAAGFAEVVVERSGGRFRFRARRP
jgi:SAM-dependent methyltransferase